MIQKVTKKTLNCLRNHVSRTIFALKNLDFSKGLDTSWFCKLYLQHKNDSTIAVNKFWFPRSTAEYIPTETLQAAINSSVLDAMHIFYVSRATCDHHNIGQGTFFTQKTWGYVFYLKNVGGEVKVEQLPYGENMLWKLHQQARKLSGRFSVQFRPSLMHPCESIMKILSARAR